jgi:hypothetical protein
MVSSINPGATGVNALGVDPRFSRPSSPQARNQDVAGAAGDRVDVSGPAAWSAARESVRTGLAQMHETMVLAQEAQSMIVAAQAMARTDGAAQEDLKSLLDRFAERVDASVSNGTQMAAGEAISVQAEPGATVLTINGIDLRLKAEPGEGDVLQLSSKAQLSDSGLGAAAQRSLEMLQAAITPLLDAARSLEAHQGFLGAAEMSGVRGDIDTDGARLLALQVRQALQSVGSAPIANVEPQAVLSLFRG